MDRYNYEDNDFRLINERSLELLKCFFSWISRYDFLQICRRAKEKGNFFSSFQSLSTCLIFSRTSPHWSNFGQVIFPGEVWYVFPRKKDTDNRVANPFEFPYHKYYWMFWILGNRLKNDTVSSTFRMSFDNENILFPLTFLTYENSKSDFV